jgi:hemolysin III
MLSVLVPPGGAGGSGSPLFPRSAARADGRPFLRGWVHALATPLAFAAAWGLLSGSPGGASRMSVAVFGVCMVGLYTTSSVYHLGSWSTRARRVLSRCDSAMILLFIAATFTPVAFHTLDGHWRTWSLVGAWTVALVGAVLAASPLVVPRWLGTLGYVAFGWLSVVPFTRIMLALPWEASGLIVLGGLLYTAGAIVFARQRPDPIPTFFGYHEVFHLFVVAGSTAHYLAIWRYVLPAG